MLSSASLVTIKQSLPPSLDKKYNRDFLPQFLLLPNPVGKITITSRPVSSSFTTVSCFLLRIIFCFSLLTLRRSRALSILKSAESAIFSLTVCHLLPWEICEGSSNMIDICMALYQSVFSAHWCADYSRYGSFLAGSISKTSSPLPFFESRLRRQNFNQNDRKKMKTLIKRRLWHLCHKLVNLVSSRRTEILCAGIRLLRNRCS